MRFNSRVRHPTALSARLEARSARLSRYVFTFVLATFMLLAAFYAVRGSGGPGMFIASLFGVALVGWWRQLIWGHMLAILALGLFLLCSWASVVQDGPGIAYPSLTSLPSWAMWLVAVGSIGAACLPLVVRTHHLRRAWW
jgi:hypothetical protein